jgi:hypothetical protein
MSSEAVGGMIDRLLAKGVDPEFAKPIIPDPQPKPQFDEILFTKGDERIVNLPITLLKRAQQCGGLSAVIVAIAIWHHQNMKQAKVLHVSKEKLGLGLLASSTVRRALRALEAGKVIRVIYKPGSKSTIRLLACMRKSRMRNSQEAGSGLVN